MDAQPTGRTNATVRAKQISINLITNVTNYHYTPKGHPTLARPDNKQEFIKLLLPYQQVSR